MSVSETRTNTLIYLNKVFQPVRLKHDCGNRPSQSRMEQKTFKPRTEEKTCNKSRLLFLILTMFLFKVVQFSSNFCELRTRSLKYKIYSATEWDLGFYICIEPSEHCRTNANSAQHWCPVQEQTGFTRSPALRWESTSYQKCFPKKVVLGILYHC